MGLGSWFLLLNATPWNITKISNSQHPYQMNTWDWPQVFLPGTRTRVYMESRAGIDGQDDAGDVSYTLGSKVDSIFEIAYHDHENADPTVSINWKSLMTLNNPIGSTTQLRWRHDNNSPFFLSTRRTSRDTKSSFITSNNPPQDWMHSIYNQISCLSVRELVVPGSHDAGMSELSETAGAAGVSAPVIVTQTLNVGKQLEYGSRYFDIRPVISGGGWKTGHYSYSKSSAGDWHGGNGQAMKDIIDQINAFTAKNNELVVLYIAEGINTDNFNNVAGEAKSASYLSQAEWDTFMNLLMSIKNRVTGISSTQDITKLKLNQLIQNRAAVIIVIDGYIRGSSKVDTSRYASQGIFSRDQFPVYNKFSNNSNQAEMISDQLVKLGSQRKSPSDEVFLLSWTLTQSTDITKPIVANGDNANQALPELLWQLLSTKTYPNILYVDAYPDNRDIAALAMAIILYFAKTC